MTGLVSPGHLVILLIVLLLVFGTKRLPELGRSLGRGMREFKDSVSGVTGKDDSDEDFRQLRQPVDEADPVVTVRERDSV